MHIETLKVFCDVIDTRSFSGAASHNFITQSAVSQQVRSLEQKYGCKLIERTRGRAQLTPAGEIFYQTAKEMIRGFTELEERLQALSDVVGGNLRIATVYSVGLYELSVPLRQFLRAYRQVNVQLDYSRSNRIHEDVLRGALDLGIVAYPSRRPYLTIIPFREDRLVLIVHPQHPLAGQKRVSLRHLDGERFVGFERDIPTRKAIDRILRSHGATPRYMNELDNIDTIKRFVEIGQGVAIVPEPAVQPEVRTGTLTALEITDEKMLRPLAIVHRKGKQLSLAASKFVEFLRTYREPAGEALTRQPN